MGHSMIEIVWRVKWKTAAEKVKQQVKNIHIVNSNNTLENIIIIDIVNNNLCQIFLQVQIIHIIINNK